MLRPYFVGWFHAAKWCTNQHNTEDYFTWFYIGNHLVCTPVDIKGEFKSKAGIDCVRCENVVYREFSVRREHIVTREEMNKRRQSNEG